ncbi:MAG: pyruvate ferredoxin oxidoreductase, partial [candidate division Zixibacteria bacterium RBG_16_48_11]
CQPEVISAYPITPQTHIVERLSQMVADGDLKSEFINVESEFSAASVILGASAAGSRAYSATTSQGLLLMAEVLFNLGGMRLPVVITCANRSVSAPINIWNDQQDAMTVRDSGIIQLFAEDNQEVYDMHLQAYKIAEDPDVSLPVIVNMDGFILTHAYEPIETITQKEAEEFLPPYNPDRKLDPARPGTFGVVADPNWYMEARFVMQKAQEATKRVIKKITREFKQKFGRFQGDLIETYRMEGAETVVVAMGSLVGTLKDLIDEERDNGKKIGVLKVRCFRPFPEEEIREVLKNVENILVFEKAFCLGLGGILYHEIRSALYLNPARPDLKCFVVGLGGRDIPKTSLKRTLDSFSSSLPDLNFVDLKEEQIKEHLYVPAS